MARTPNFSRTEGAAGRVLARDAQKIARVGMIARWQPVHRGHALVLDALCERAHEALIGVGSANRYDWRNPFTLDETFDMLRLALAGRSNYRLIPVPDHADDGAWRGMVLDLFGPLDLFVTDNPYVSTTLASTFHFMKPVQLIAPDARVPLDGTMVRHAMACGTNWQALVPKAVAEYITVNKLDARFRREFGLETLAMNTLHWS